MSHLEAIIGTDMIQSIIFTLLGLGLFVVALLLMRQQLKAKRLFQSEPSEEMTPLESRFSDSQFRRRIQCSALLAALAVGMIAESWITGLVVRVSVGAIMLVVLGWMILLALLDIIATTTHYRRMSNRYQNEQIRLEAKVKKILNDEG